MATDATAASTQKLLDKEREKHRAATKIRAYFKGFCDRFDYQDLRQTVIERQRFFRACVARNEARRAFVSLRAAVLTAQTVRRGAVEARALPSVFRARPACVVYVSAVRTGKEYMRDVTSVDPEWLPELAPHFYATRNKSGAEPPPDGAFRF